MTKVVGLGAGGHAAVVIEILRAAGDVEIVGLLDPDPNLRNTSVLGVPVLGDDALLEALHEKDVRYAFIGVGGTGDTQPRQRLFATARSHGFDMIAAVHPSAVVSPSATLGFGPTVGAGAVINARARIGDNVIVNTGAIVEHDCVIGHHVHIATGARLAGAVTIGEGTHVGIGAVVRQCLNIGPDVLVGAGAVVVGDVSANVVVTGVPARVTRERRMGVQ